MASEGGGTTTTHGAGKVAIKKTMGFLGAVSTMVGAMIGSGIFISPKGVLVYTGSFGLNLIVWGLCGLISLGGALCYAELGTLIPENGGRWVYLRTGIGNAVAFAFSFTLLLRLPTATALQGISAAEYLLAPVFGPCGAPEAVLKISGILIIWLAIYINTSVRTTTKLLKAFFFVKVGSLSMVVVGGAYWMITHGTENLQEPFKGTTDNIWGIATSFYFGLFSYHGWSSTNNLAEEVKDIYKTLPRAVVFSVLLVTGLYMFVNLSYYSILTPEQVLKSDAVVLDWGRPIVGSWAALFSIIAGLSMIGNLLVIFFSGSRILMALSRQGHFFQVLSFVHVSDNAPIIAFVFYGVMAPFAVIFGDVLSLLQFGGCIGWFFQCLVFVSLVRLKLNNYRRGSTNVFRVPIILPILMVLVSIYLVIVPVVSRPRWEYMYAALIILIGLLLHFPFMYFKDKIAIFDNLIAMLQVMFKVGVPRKNRPQ